MRESYGHLRDGHIRRDGHLQNTELEETQTLALGPAGGFLAWWNTSDATATDWLDTSEAFTLSGAATITASNADMGDAQTVDFDGATDELIESGTFAANFDGDDVPFMFTCALKFNVQTLQVPWQVYNSGDVNPRFRITHNVLASPKGIFRRDDAGTGGNMDTTTTAIFGTVARVVSFTFDGATGKLFVDGVEELSGASAIGVMTLNRFAVGSGGGASFADVDFGDIIVRSAVDTTKRESDETFLANKFGVTL